MSIRLYLKLVQISTENALSCVFLSIFFYKEVFFTFHGLLHNAFKADFALVGEAQDRS